MPEQLCASHTEVWCYGTFTLIWFALTYIWLHLVQLGAQFFSSGLIGLFIWFVSFIWVQIICLSHLECHKQISHLNATTTIDRILKIYPVVQWPGGYYDTAQKCCYPTLGKPAPAISIHGSWPNYKWWLPPQQLWWPTLPSQHCKSFFLTHVVSCSSNFLVIWTFKWRSLAPH